MHSGLSCPNRKGYEGRDRTGGFAVSRQGLCHRQRGFHSLKVCFSDNWFQSRRWQAYVEKQAEDREKAAALEADHYQRLVYWISDRSPMCKHITGKQIDGLLASKLVTQAQIQAAGLGL